MLDLSDLAAGMARPGSDPRTWCSFGIVVGSKDPDADDACVIFDGDQPLVLVRLEPSLVVVRARLLTPVAGNGEASYVPYLPNDEVFCLIAEGHERAGVVIAGKLNNAIDKFPSGSVAGQDPRKNNFAFRRTRTPVIEELYGPVMMRSAKSGGFLSIDDAGVVLLRGGGVTPDDPAPALQLGPDVVGMQGPGTTNTPSEFLVQLNITDEVFLARARDAIVSLGSSKSTRPNMIGVPGALAIGVGGNPALEHVTTIEAVANFLYWELTSFAAMVAALGGAPLTGTSLGAAIVTWLSTGYPATVPVAAAAALPTPVLAAILTALTAQAATPKPNTPAGQSFPGLGAANLLTG